MARFFIILLIALLPLRGWAAERMVYQMNRGTPVSMQGQVVGVAMTPDCAMNSGGSQETSTTMNTADNSECQVCQLCMPLVALDNIPMVHSAPITHKVAVRQFSDFVSADPARTAKPPIF